MGGLLPSDAETFTSLKMSNDRGAKRQKLTEDQDRFGISDFDPSNELASE